MAFTASIADIIAEDKTGLLAKHESWERVRLSEVVVILNGAPFDSARFSATEGVPLARIRDVVAGRTSTYYTGEYDDAYLIGPGDFLVGMDGDFNTGYWGAQVALLNQRVCKLTPNPTFYDKALLGHVLSGYLAAINAHTSSITVKHLSSKTIGDIELPLPPRAEQTRIAEKLDELLSDLDAGVAELMAAQRKIARYRQSLLKAAVEGALTADWRDSHGAREAEVLPRVLSDRRGRWEAMQLAKFTEQGKTPPRGWQVKYPNPVAPAGRLPQLPASWTWATLSQIGFLDRGRSKHRPRNAPHLYGGAYPFVQTGDIRHADTFLDRAESTYSEAGLAQSRLWPAGTMCITIAANIGKTAILAMDACFPDSVVGFLPASTCVSIRYVEYFMRTAQQSLEDDAPATAQKNINLEILEKLRVPLPPYEEQLRIVELLDELLKAATDQEHAIAISVSKAAAQRKSALRAAFSGELVSQDPNDEPAAKLLLRIAESRNVVPTEAKSRKKKSMRRSSPVEDVRLLVRKMPSDRFSSEDLFASTGGDYDAFKDSLFELLTEEDPILRQEFDGESRRMILVRGQA